MLNFCATVSTVTDLDTTVKTADEVTAWRE